MDKNCQDFESFKTNKKKKYKSKKSEEKVDDFLSIFTDIFNAINYKIGLLLFVLGIMICTTIQS